MNKKRDAVVFILCGMFLLSILSMGFVSADVADNINTFGKGVWKVLEQPLEFILDTQNKGDFFLFPKLLFLILVFIIVWIVLEKIEIFEGRDGIITLISIIISILAIRFIGSASWIEVMLVPYSSLGIILVTVFPLLILFWFNEKIVKSRIMRKIVWIFSACVFLGLYVTRWSDISEELVSGSFNPGHIYWIAAIACLLFLWFDKTIQDAFYKAKVENVERYHKNKEVTKLIRDINEFRNDIADGNYEGREEDLNKEKNIINKRAKRLNVEGLTESL